MSPARLERSADLRRLRDEGYEIAICDTMLVMRNVPYVTSARTVERGTLISSLDLAGEITTRPSTHVVHFAGSYPCDHTGVPIEALRHQTMTVQLTATLTAEHSFSNKPPEGYADYYEKMTSYARILSAPAAVIEPGTTPRTFAPVTEQATDSPFAYTDTNSSRAEIPAITSKLEGHRIGIVGLGGTGSYVLDQVAKTPVATIALFDGDRYLQHGAFRSPGAPSLEELEKAPLKVDYFKAIYSRMHKGIEAHALFIDATNVSMLGAMSFVFVCIDVGSERKVIVDFLVGAKIPFIDVGMGVHAVDGTLRGVVRTTLVTPACSSHIGQRISFADGEDDYAKNIQISELNMLNAALAVIRWKKLVGFYADLEHEHDSTYTIDVNLLTSDDHAA